MPRNRGVTMLGPASLFALFAWACGGGPTATPVYGVPTAANPLPTKSQVLVTASASFVSVVEGEVALGTPTGVWKGSRTQAGTVSPMTVVATGSDPSSTGAVGFLTRRSSGGLLVLAGNGLFIEDLGYLLASPLTQSLSSLKLRTVDAFGVGANEELWLTTDSGAYYVGAGKVTQLQLAGVVGTPDALVATAPGQAVLTASGSAYLVDFAKSDATLLASQMGAVHGFDHAEDGTVYLATASGLLSRDRAGKVQLSTFAAQGSPAVEVFAVSAAFGTVIASTAVGLVQVLPTGAVALSTLAAPTSGRTVAVDANGDAWAVDRGNLWHFATGKAVSYNTDVKPFLDRHCMTCHATGTSGAPTINFDDYTTAKGLAPVMVQRLQALNTTPMPPATAETLTSTDYAVVTRWYGSGLLP